MEVRKLLKNLEKNQLFHDYEDFFEKNDILYIVDFGFISEI